MYIALISLIIFVCLLLALVVLAQNPKGGGLSSQFGAGGTAQLMGVKRTGDLLERLTWGFAIALMVLSLGTQMVSHTSGDSAPVRSVNQQRALETRVPATTPAPAPATPAPSTPAPAPATPAQ
ncbi:preprotein translocase subunit SecG [Hymenobacter sp. BT730]|uniref:preprotein translocase subunit SecG n=1 Tax=Hymenobacter sp. BT730 TaxID=3063332 RepID=UPI0026DFB265|nr:preprotein translocase subunit SecG [Hymenobacter sp. BT730]